MARATPTSPRMAGAVSLQSPRVFNLRFLLTVALLLSATGSATPQIFGPDVEITKEFTVGGNPFELAEHTPEVAAMDNVAVAAWWFHGNTRNVFWSHSTNGGLAWTHMGVLPQLGSSHFVVGFPSVCADSAGTFTIATLYGTSSGRTVGIYTATPAPGQSTFVLSGPTFATPFFLSSEGRLMLPRITCDPSNGNLYLSYSRIAGPGATVYLATFIDGAWTPPIVLGTGVCLGSRPVVGPDGELYVFWEDFGTSRVIGRRSDDQGTTFGPEFTVGTTLENFTNPPGYFYDGADWLNPSLECVGDDAPPDFPSIDIDRSLGSNRGTIYAAWTEHVSGTPNPITSSFGEIEPNDTAEMANRIEFGQQVSGTTVSPDLIGHVDDDFFYFDGVAGQTIWLEGEVTGVSGHGVPTSGEFCQFVHLLGQGSPSDFGPRVFSWQIARLAQLPPSIWTVPSDGRYGICLFSNSRYSVSYRLRLRTLIPDGTGTARDHRDVILTKSSDGGQTWTPKILVNDDPPQFDNFMPELAVDGIGGVHVSWYDRRDDPEAGEDYNVYWTYSDDGAMSFRPSQRLSDTTSVRGSNAGLELGDHMGLAPYATGVQSVWTQAWLHPVLQSSGVDHDIHARRVDVIPDIQARAITASSEVGTHGTGPRRLRLQWSVADPNFVYRFRVFRSSEEFGPYNFVGEVGVSGDGGAFVEDDRRPNEVLHYRVDTIRTDGQVFEGTPVQIKVPARPGLTWRSASPNPATGTVNLELESPREGDLEIRIFDARGAVVRSLFRGSAASGTNRFDWDGRNDTGQRVVGGIYFIEAAMGNDRTRRKIIRTGH
jgi:hypothetical protein